MRPQNASESHMVSRTNAFSHFVRSCNASGYFDVFDGPEAPGGKLISDVAIAYQAKRLVGLLRFDQALLEKFGKVGRAPACAPGNLIGFF